MNEDYYYGDEKEDTRELTFSYAQLEHLGPQQKEGLEGIFQVINAGEGMSAALRKAGQMRIDPVDRFKILCSIYYDKLGGDNSFIVKWNTIISKFPSIKWPQYRNPIGFILGARIIGKNRLVEEGRLSLTCDIFKDTMTKESIHKKDVLRYGRYWESLLKND